MKKIVSLISMIAIFASMAFTVSADGPRMYLEVVNDGGKVAGGSVQIAIKYDGFGVTPYSEADGTGAKITSFKASFNIPGGMETPVGTEDQQFNRAGAAVASGLSSGSVESNFDITNDVFAVVVSGASDPMEAAGTLCTVTLPLKKDITTDLEFDFIETDNTYVYYDTFEYWSATGTVCYATQPTAVDLELSSADGTVIAAPAPATKLVAVDGLTGDLEKYNEGYLMQQIMKSAAATATQKIKVYSVADAEDYQVMERTVWEALGIEAADDVEAGTADISGLTVVVMVPESKAATYAQGFDFVLVD